MQTLEDCAELPAIRTILRDVLKSLYKIIHLHLRLENIFFKPCLGVSHIEKAVVLQVESAQALLSLLSIITPSSFQSSVFFLFIGASCYKAEQSMLGTHLFLGLFLILDCVICLCSFPTYLTLITISCFSSLVFYSSSSAVLFPLAQIFLISIFLTCISHRLQRKAAFAVICVQVKKK